MLLSTLAFATALSTNSSPVKSEEEPAFHIESSVPDDEGQFEISIKNEGKANYNINLGLSVGNGIRHIPSNLELHVLRQGKKEIYKYTAIMMGISGRLDDLVISLLARSSYSLEVNLSDFRSTTDNTTPTPGSLRMTTVLHSTDYQTSNSGEANEAKFKLWQGMLESKPIEFILK
ncbi:MAG: hypothetical protein KF836_00385 [Fimbriimonadaceae bacterium]|nr:hypothetical protein [Fimbriimonadaceae bacterium]